MDISYELKAYKILIKNSFNIEVNMNDTFWYATADSEQIEANDVDFLVPVIARYGDAAINAYVAIKRQIDPTVKQHLTYNFYRAKTELARLFEQRKILHDILDDQEKVGVASQLVVPKYEFDGQTLSWTTFTNRFVKLLNKNPKQGVYLMYLVRLEDGTFSIGRSQSEVITRLQSKYNRKKKNRLIK